jgi:hypothetical protein
MRFSLIMVTGGRTTEVAAFTDNHSRHLGSNPFS